MSRNIPPVRRWRVRFYLEHTLLADITVDAVNRMFAQWAAKDRLRAVHLDRYLASDKMTCSPVKRSSHARR